MYTVLYCTVPLHVRIRTGYCHVAPFTSKISSFSKHEFNRRPRFIVFRSDWICSGRKGETAPKKTRERERAHRRSETAEQREERLSKRRARDRARRTAQSAEERHLLLQRRRLHEHDNETTQQLETRLQRTRVNAWLWRPGYRDVRANAWLTQRERG